MAIGSIINLGGGGGSISGAKGVIICDTSTMTVGDTIRVRDVYDSQNVQNKQVITVGTPVIFEVDWGCYYKICTVQTINDTPTEIGGVYKTVDYGQTLFIDTLNLDSLAGHQGLLNAHQHTNKLAIGDEVTITYGGNDWIVQVADFNTYVPNSIIYASKNLTSPQAWTSATTSDVYYADGTQRTTMQGFYNNIAEKDRQFIKKLTKIGTYSAQNTSGWKTFEDFVWSPNAWEVYAGGPGPTTGNPGITLKQFALFTTQANRVKKYNGSGLEWWTCDGVGNGGTSTKQAYYINQSGGGSSMYNYPSYGLCPCFCLIADS